MLLNDLEKKKLIHPPKFLASNTCYLTIMGSEAYGVSSGDSDKDIYGIAIPSREDVFPHLKGEILGFGRQKNRFEQYQEHHCKDQVYEYDFSVYSIIKYFNLAMENNPNIVDALFTPNRCVIHITKIGQNIREHRKMFLHKGCWHKFKGYAYSQIKKMNDKNPQEGSKRAANVEEFGFDTKFAYHVVRLMLEVEQILTEQDLDLERNREQLKAIRRGEWTLNQIKEFFDLKEKLLEETYSSSELPYEPDENKIKMLLLECLEEHYGSIKDAIVIPNQTENLMNDIKEVLNRYENIS